ncbi:membrane protein [Caballeronia peredens]|nr:membrane protein [Caballeronia peredens]
MKSFVKALAVAVVVVAPALSFAQTDSSLSRAQVKQDLRQVEAAGYDPSRSDQTSYPSDIQAAESRVSRQNGAAPADMNSYGGTTGGASASGMRAMRPMNNDGTKPVYFGH